MNALLKTQKLKKNNKQCKLKNGLNNYKIQKLRKMPSYLIQIILKNTEVYNFRHKNENRQINRREFLNYIEITLT